MLHEAGSRMIGIGFVTLMAACSADPKAGSTPRIDAPRVATAADAAAFLLLCGADTVSVTGVREDTLALHVQGETFKVHHVPSASGARYQAAADTGTGFWSQGDRAMVQVRGESLPECEMIVGTGQ